MSKTARWLDLIAYLMDRTEPVTRETIFERIADYRADWNPSDPTSHETLRRKFERDKDELRGWGIPIETVELDNADPGEANAGYRLNRRDTYLPYLQLRAEPTTSPEPTYRNLRTVTFTQDEVDVLDRVTAQLKQRDELALSGAAASLRRKLEFDLPLSHSSVERILAQPVITQARKALAKLQDAVSNSIPVTCEYYTIGRDDRGRRTLDPYGLFFTWGKWYLVAYDRDRQDRRVFRIDRVRDVQWLTTRNDHCDVPRDFSIQEYLHRAPWELAAAPNEEVVVRFAFPESRSVLAKGLGQPVADMLDDGGARIVFGVRERDPFLRWLLTFRGRATIESPDAVVRELDELQRAVARLYGDAE